MTIKATPAAAKNLLSPENHALILLDHQSQMAFNVKSHDISLLRNATGLLAETAKGFHVPTLISTISRHEFAGPVFDEVAAAFPNDKEYVNRTTSNAWEDPNFIDAVNKLGRNRLVMAGLWTSVCLNGPVQSALEQGFEVYVVTDASGDSTTEAHERAVERMIQQGARPITALTYLLELQRDWARTETYELTTSISRKYGGAFGVGIQYAHDMLQHG